MADSLKNKTYKNVSYNAVGKMLSFAFQALANIILSRELIAEDYGIVSFAVICVTFMINFSGFGLSQAAIHTSHFDEKSKNTLFTTRLILSLLAFLILIVFAGFTKYFIEQNEITAVIRVLSFNLLISNLSLVSSVCLERKLKYLIISIAETALAMTSSITAIILALNGFRYWSIVYASILSNIVFAIIICLCMPYKYKLQIDKGIAKEYFKYGSYILCTGTVLFVTYNIDNFVIGTVAGVSQLGYYAIAFNWGSLVCTVMFGVVFTVLFPTFTKMRDDPDRMKRAYLQVIQYTALISFLWNIGLFCVADNFLYTVLGKGTDKWDPALQTLRILCFYGVIRALVAPASSFMMALGNTKIQFKASIVTALIELPLVYPAIKYGSIEIVGLVVLLSYACQFAIYLPALKKSNNILCREITAKIWPAVVAGIFMYICYYFLDGLFSHSLAKLFVNIFVLTFVYVLTYGVLTRWRLYIDLKNLVFVGK